MACAITAGNSHIKRTPIWSEISSCFSDDKECLAAFIAFESAGVLEGLKPSILINLPDRPRRCGRNFYTIWKEYGMEILSESTLEVMVMVERHDSILLLVYDRSVLEMLLSSKGVKTMLRKAGYQSERGTDVLLSEFASRFKSGGIPHEVGIILGYPLKDVAGFMGVGRLKFTCQGPWRIYGDPSESLMLAEAYRWCRCRMAARLTKGGGPFDCLVGSCRPDGKGRRPVWRMMKSKNGKIGFMPDSCGC